MVIRVVSVTKNPDCWWYLDAVSYNSLMITVFDVHVYYACHLSCKAFAAGFVKFTIDEYAIAWGIFNDWVGDLEGVSIIVFVCLGLHFHL